MLLCVSVGFSVAVIDEDGTQQLHITEVKPEGLASAKGTYLYIFDINSASWDVIFMHRRQTNMTVAVVELGCSSKSYILLECTSMLPENELIPSDILSGVALCDCTASAAESAL